MTTDTAIKLRLPAPMREARGNQLLRATGSSIRGWLLLFLIFVCSIEGQAARPEDDAFTAPSLNTCRWFDWSHAGTVSQNNSIRLQTSAADTYSSARVISQYMVKGDISMEITVTADSGFAAPISASAQMYVAFGLWADDGNFVNISVSKAVDRSLINVLRNSSSGGFQNFPHLQISSPSARLRITQAGGQITLEYNADGVWYTAAVVDGYPQGAYVSLQATTVGVARQFVGAFSDFAITSGATSYRQYVRSPLAARPDFMRGGVVTDYIYHRTWGGRWQSIDPLQVMHDNGMKWVRTGVTTKSIPALKNTAVSQWSSLGFQNSFWSSQEVAAQVLKEASARGLKLNLFLYLSDQAAHAGAQNAPPEWSGLSVADTAAKVRQHAQSLAADYKAQGISIDLYEIGNEIDFGILNFRPGERIAIPPGVDFVKDLSFMRGSVWPIEATLLKAAIEGIRAADPGAKIALHAAGLAISPADIFVKGFFKAMVDNGVSFDYAGLSHPYVDYSPSLARYSTDCWFQRLQETVDYIATLGKPVIFSEAGYPNATNGISGAPMPEFPFSDSGQAAWVREQLRFGSNNPNVAGFMYFYPEWYPGMGDASTLNLQSSGLFNSNETPKPALAEFANAGSDSEAPTMPAGLTALAVGSRQINLAWSASTDNVGVSQYNIYRNDSLIATLSAPATGYGDTGVMPSTTYVYTVTACDAAANCSPLSSSSPTTPSPPPPGDSTFTAELVAGFNLIGNSLDAPLSVPAIFGSLDGPVEGVTANIASVWKWDAVNRRWAFYAPQLTGAGNAAYAASRNYDVLATINPGEGYWVNAAESTVLPAQSGNGFHWTSFSFGALASGFNLITQASTATPTQFNAAVNATPPAPGEVPTGNFVTLWMWDAPLGRWYFHSPILEASGGLGAVKAYADAHGYLHFQDHNKTLGVGGGFWVNKP